MSVAERFENEPVNNALTHEISDWLVRLDTSDISERATTWAKHALLDWFGVTLAGSTEPLVDMLVEEYTAEAGGACTIVGRGRQSILSHAALINGAASHALDYDDVSRRLHGHPTVPVAPVVLALAEHLGASGRDVLTAFIVGTEIECLIGEMAGHGHYDAGFHATGTIGTFGATAAAAKMMALDTEQTRRAIGIAASQAAGLKANFGTMTKPLHAGKAAMNGLMAARLAARGFTADENILERPLGVADVMMPGFVAGSTLPQPGEPFAVEQTLFKYHAACYLTHASIEAIKTLRANHHVGLDDLARLTLYCSPGHFTVCNISEPQTGLEIKFSLRHCAAMALDGVDTSALESYSDDHAHAPRFVRARSQIEVEGREAMDRMTGHVVMELKDGRRLEAEHDAGAAATDLDAQGERLTAKFRALSTPIVGAERTQSMIDAVSGLDQAGKIDELMAAAG